MSTFHGLEMAKRALSAQQAALHTTGHNISNAHTEGYSRQRVNFETDSPYPSPSRNKPGIPGQIGTGVKIGSIERIRSEYLDTQFRTENSRAGYWEAQKANLSRIEGLLNEPSDSGLSQTMKQFWQSLQDLGVNPDNSGVRSVVKERGIAVAETFQHLSRSIQSIQQDMKQEITDGNVKQINSLVDRISEINKQIERVEPHGYLPNDLYDERDVLIDELSSFVNIKVTNHETGGNRQASASGTVSIQLVNKSGKPMDGVYLIDGDGDKKQIDVNFETDEAGYDVVSEVIIGETNILKEMGPVGSLKGLIDAFGSVEQVDDTSLPGLLKELDKMAHEFAKKFNEVHGEPSFFTEINTARSIKVSDTIKRDPANINTSDGNALNLAAVLDDSLEGLDEKSVNEFYQSLIGQLGVDTEHAMRMEGNTAALREQVQEQRMSVSAVSLDEEMTNMIKFQHAYNAAARSMTSMDEMLDRIINGMGLVGR